MELDLTYTQACKLLLPSYESINLALVGCGGTGSWLAPSVVRVARLLREKYQKNVLVHFVDPDVVEGKNVYRQNFCDAEIGRNKAVTLAWRYGLAWGVEIVAIPAKFATDMFPRDMELTILIGCVDGPAGRREIGSYHNRHLGTWWLDCGNHKSAGQVLLGGGRKGSRELPGFVSWLPQPSAQHPELLEAETYTPQDESGLSCADLAMRDSQGLAINQRVAAEASDYLVRMLLTKDLQKYATYLDLASGSSRSIYIMAEKGR